MRYGSPRYQPLRSTSAYGLRRTGATGFEGIPVQQLAPAPAAAPLPSSAVDDASETSVLMNDKGITTTLTAREIVKNGLSFGSYVMHVVFSPVTNAFTCYYHVQENDNDPKTPCCGKWTATRAVKTGVVAVALILYIMGFVWIVSIYEGVQACKMGGMSAPTDPTGLAMPLKYYAHCMSDDCQLTTGVGNMNLPTYIDLRLAMYLISSFPAFYLIFMVAYHIQQVSADMRGNDEINLVKPWHMLGLGLMSSIELMIGVVLFVLDIGATNSISTDWGAVNSTCYKAEQQMLDYQGGFRISIKDLPIALAVLGIPYTLWSLLFLLNEIVKLAVYREQKSQAV